MQVQSRGERFTSAVTFARMPPENKQCLHVRHGAMPTMSRHSHGVYPRRPQV